MSKDALKTAALILAWATAFGILFLAIAAAASYFTGFAFLDATASLQNIGILVALCIGGVFAQRRFRLFRAFQPTSPSPRKSPTVASATPTSTSP